MTLGRNAILAGLALALGAGTGHAQGVDDLSPGVAAGLLPPDVRYALEAAETILTDSPPGAVSLESFHADTVTGVFLEGSYDGQPRSIGYGTDAVGRKYLWFSVGEGDSLDYVASLFDVDRDLTPDFLILRTIDRGERRERTVEYRAPRVAPGDFDITFQPACQLPRCDPTAWTVQPREHVEVPAEWFAPWRAAFGVAASRGEPWLGRSVAALPAPNRPSGPPSGP